MTDDLSDVVRRWLAKPEAFSVIVHLASGVVVEGEVAPLDPRNGRLLELTGPNVHPTFIRYDAIQAIEFIE